MSAELFPDTRWSLIQSARAGEKGLEEWCRLYMLPAREYFKALGCERNQAEDLVQEFMYRLVLKGADSLLPEHLEGSFRAYLKRSLRNFLIDQRRAVMAARRGGGLAELDIAAIELASKQESPDIAFDRAWLLRVMDMATERLRQEFTESGKVDFFEAVAPLLDGRRAHASIAAQLGMSEAAFRAALYRLRKRYRCFIEEEIRETVTDSQKFEEEMRHLMNIWK